MTFTYAISGELLALNLADDPTPAYFQNHPIGNQIEELPVLR